MGEEVERVTVNGMKMYRLGNQLFFSKSEAIEAAKKRAKEELNIRYGCPLDEYDPIALLIAGEILRGIKL